MFRSYHDTVRTPKETEKSEAEVYHCNMCVKGGWLTETDLEIHKKDDHYVAINEYKAKFKDRFCTICMTVRESNEELISHIKSQHLLSSPTAQRVERMIYICDECTHVFFNKNALSTHMWCVHITKKYKIQNDLFSCPKCFKKCLLKSIWYHFQKHEIPSVSLCDICLTNFPSRKKLHQHMETHRRYYKCETCGYNSTKDFHYKAHMHMHTLREIPHRKVSHTVINSVFNKHKNSFIKYNIHNAIKGLILPKFIDICTLCREICLSQPEMKAHILRDHMYDETEKKNHFCACGEEFDYKVVLKQHILKMKGSHKPVEDINVQAVKTKEGKLKPLLKFNNCDPVETPGTVVSENEGNADVISVEISEADVEDQPESVETELSKNIELVPSPMESTQDPDADKIAMEVSVANALPLTQSTS